MHLFIQTNDGKKYLVELDNFTKVSDLKSYLGRLLRVPMCFSRLVYKQQLLTNDMNISEVGLKHMSTLDLYWEPQVLTPKMYNEKMLELDEKPSSYTCVLGVCSNEAVIRQVPSASEVASMWNLLPLKQHKIEQAETGTMLQELDRTVSLTNKPHKPAVSLKPLDAVKVSKSLEKPRAEKTARCTDWTTCLMFDDTDLSSKGTDSDMEELFEHKSKYKQLREAKRKAKARHFNRTQGKYFSLKAGMSKTSVGSS